MSIAFDKSAFFIEVTKVAFLCGYKTYRGKNSGKFIKSINTGNLMAYYKINIKNLRIDCSISFFHERLYEIMSLVIDPNVDADGRWFVCVGSLFFPTPSNVWDEKILPCKDEHWHAIKVTKNLSRATVALEDICNDLDKIHYHLISNDEIAEQLQIMPTSRIQAAIALSIYLNKSDAIFSILETYFNNFNKFGTAPYIMEAAYNIIERAHKKNYIDIKLFNRIKLLNN